MGIFNKQRLCDEYVVIENYSSYRLVKQEKQGFHWVWWGACLLLFWPAIFIMGLLAYSKDVYQVVLIDKNGRRDKWWISADIYEEVVEMLDKAV